VSSSDVGTNPAFITRHPTIRSMLYASTERIDENGQIITLSFDAFSGQLRPLQRTCAAGRSTCYLNFHKSLEYMLAVNYWDAKVTTLPLDASGSLLKASDCIMQPGAQYVIDNEPDRTEHWAYRQRWPHSHCIVAEPYSRKLFFVTDLGQDAIFAYNFDETEGKPVELARVSLQKGLGPRHMVFHPTLRVAYVVNELKSSVSVLAYNGLQSDSHLQGSLEFDSADGASPLLHVHTLTTLPADYEGQGTIVNGVWKAKSHCAEIRLHPDGRFLYLVNRGHDSIACFAVDQCDGTLTAVGLTPTGGACPRNFNFDASGEFVVVGNQDSNNLTVFSVDRQTGALAVTDIVEMNSPNYIYSMPWCE